MTKQDQPTTAYAIIKSGGKQHRVAVNDIIDVELLHQEEGAQVNFSDVLFYHDGNKPTLGFPIVKGCSVTGQVLGEASGPKITSIKYKPSHHQYRKFGHRQHYSRVKITAIG